jgi:non-specific serine/threonine protein kinase
MKLLLVVDNCEHLIEAVATLAETLLAHCPGATIVATSRETLRIQGEHVYRVPPLDIPAPGLDQAEHILGHSAVELFITRTKALGADFSSQPGELPRIGAICRHLDGIPLAIEFAAAHASALGTQTVLASLRDRFALLTSGRRGALPRHQTLRAALDWSYQLLTEAEQRLLRHLAIFSGGFTLEAATAVVNDSAVEQSSILEGIGNLVAKSLVTMSRDAVSRWYLLETTRAYGLEKLADAGEAAWAPRRHAEFCLALFAPFGTEGQLQAALDDFERYRVELDNLRAALNWAFSPAGDAALGVALAAAAADFWNRQPLLLLEAFEWAGKALARLGDDAGTRREMLLRYSFGTTSWFTKPTYEATRDAFARALTLARELADLDYQQRATNYLWVYTSRAGNQDDALAVARQFEDAARFGDAQSRAVVDCWIGMTQVYRGAHVEAIERIRRGIDGYPAERRRLDMVRFGYDLPNTAGVQIAFSLMSRGLLDTASRDAANAIERVRGANRPDAVSFAMAWPAGFIFLNLGELATAERYCDELIHYALEQALGSYHAVGICVRGILAAKRGDPAAGCDEIRRGLTEMRGSSFRQSSPIFAVEFATALAAIDRIDEGLAELDAALRFATETARWWFVPETLRVKGELLALRGAGDSAVVNCWHRGLELARAQDALFWELRLAASLARLRAAQNRHGEARQILAPVYDRFTEGFGTPDLRAAKVFLDELPG